MPSSYRPRCQVRARSALGEAWRTVWSNSTPALLLTALMVTVCGGLGVADASAVAHVVRSRQAFVARGDSTWVIGSAGGISGQVCDKLAGSGSIVGSGAVRVPDQSVPFASAPGTAVTFLQATPGLLAFLDPAPFGQRGLLLSPDLAQTLGAQQARTIRMSDGRIASVVGVMSELTTVTTLQNAAIDIEQPSGAYDACWVQTSGAQDAELLGELAALPGAPAGPPQITQLDSTLGSTPSAVRDYADRASRFAPVAAAACGVVIGIGAVRRRRLELASARHMGQSRAALTLQAGVEAGVVAVATIVIGSLGVLIVARAAPRGAVVSVAEAGARPLVTGPALLVVATMLAAATLRESSLYAYFKER